MKFEAIKKKKYVNFIFNLLLTLLIGIVFLDLEAAESEPINIKEAILQGKSLSSLKSRYEFVDQDGKSKNANALTVQTLLGWETKPIDGISFALQFIGVSPLIDDYNDKKNGVSNLSKVNYPVVVDPEGYNINQAFISYTHQNKHNAKVGRQAIFLDNWRFVGDVRFRQNIQVMDGITTKIYPYDGIELFLSHVENIRQVTTKNQNTRIELANLKYKISKSGSLVGYGYFVDWDDESQKIKSDKTFGARLNGLRPASEEWDLLYTLEYADQSSYKDGSSLIDNYYYRVGFGVGQESWSLRFDQEKLSGNANGKAFQTNLGTNHLFQGWADVFLTTPNQGIIDNMIIAKAKILGATIKSEFHLIDSDRNFTTDSGSQADNYGHEFDIGIYYPIKKDTKVSLEYANFSEGDTYSTARKRDIEKIWLTLIYKF
ncbi:MAG: hypothetical protein HOF49_05725 [Nitrosomonadales bacterium]|jgi:hypothetical protein|nr:hypothetical protein [Nitrosomonadales bacterium]MBT4182877.1 hypothetical protein [Nitrosomonadales bacterium]MBT4759723.1 hypothetical protein [Nitrosomonadales bacterium]MBT5149951.1 hypothetical protein [Nitrosomonadales bacterium]MBT5573231.1 hypothetical protein [Nitrosomonadales bacterium]